MVGFLLPMLLGGVMGIGMSPLSAVMSPVSTAVQNWAYRQWPSKQLDVPTLLEAKRRQIIPESEFTKGMNENGFGGERLTALLRFDEQMIGIGDLLSGFLTKRVDEPEFYSRIEKYHFTREEAEKLTKITQFYPSAMDFIRFMVREVFREDVVTEYKMDEDFDIIWDSIKEYLLIDENVLKWYCRSHWELVSPQMGFEFLHRLNPEVLKVLGAKYKEMGLSIKDIQFTEENLDDLLKYADYMGFYRPKIRAISYNPLTRVDLRRIYALGLIDEVELHARLMEVGYASTDAELMVEFYKKYVMGSERDLSKAQILEGYKTKELSREQTIELIGNLGYDTDETELIITLEENKQATKELQEEIKALKAEYNHNVITIEEFTAEIEKMDLSEASKRYYTVSAQREKREVIESPTKADLKSWLSKKIIEESEFKTRMIDKGFNPKDIENYLKEAMA